MPKTIFLLIAILLRSTLAFAAEKPNEIGSYIHATTPYGTGQFTAYWMTIYDADLWTDAARWSWDEPFALSLHYRMDISGSDISDKSIDAMDVIQPLTAEDRTDYKNQFDKIFPDVQEGDEITALYLPGKSLLFYHNGAPIGTITDMALARRFMSIWFSEKTLAPRLRQHLLAFSKHPKED